ncbi:hypothetical protein I3843_08G018500 [Carya illinoinensis]|uniref:Uncharacterized protein n=1 Tax=Carya illinoinensis TaxID=32201 RepID=A0A922E892_CARIL|nr:hypothetical protein I3842_08G017900 [Carya illinoinensis]KAG7965800.1 hypothetical protein I3843_08G018500 [Carya illinoinensis]
MFEFHFIFIPNTKTKYQENERFLQFHLSVKFQASGNRIIPFASLNFWFDSFPLPKRKKPRVHQVDKMNRPTA